MAEKKLGFKFPHVFALMFMITVFMAILTWIVPAGQFTRVKEGTITKVVAGSYHVVPAHPQGFWEVFLAVVKGWEQAAVMIFMVFFVGGAIHILEQTGTIRIGLGRIVRGLKGREMFAVGLVMTIMSIGGATGVFANPVVALMPIGLMLSKALGYDEVVGFGMIYLGAYAGFNVGWGNVFTVGIAHSVAQLPMFSGMGVRVLFHVVNLALTFGFVYMYCRKIKADPTQSLTYEPGKMAAADAQAAGNEKEEQLTWRHMLCAAIAFIGFAAIIYGSLKLKWGIRDYSVIFFMMAVLSGIVGGLGVTGTATAFVRGCGTMVYAAFVIGMARAISVVMSDGRIIDSIIHYLSMPIAQMGPVLGANMMLAANIIINFFIPSGSGQAVTVMPIMVPLADLTGITRQVATQAFQFGDGFTNCIMPTAGVVMGCLGIAGISYERYVKWFWPFLVVQLVLAFVAITVLQLMKWGPA
ncbi:YfcC family protein [Anaeroselena agilis]|uniref:AbgT family transporter n=1 Tax=Anaeroselena agilis TaxID=3063788 RepID=A0ABU3NZZ7_9FIRM|nr:AbgT family transporter [Selenomonadales bacterium 4137-cl]